MVQQQHLGIDDVADVAVVAAATFDASEKVDDVAKRIFVTKSLNQSIATPNVAISRGEGEQVLVRATDDSPFAMELLVCNKLFGRPGKEDFFHD